MRWTVLDCRTKGVQRLTVVDRETERVVCRIESVVSGRPIEQDDIVHASLIASAPDLQARVAEQRNEVLNAISDLERGDSLMALMTLKRIITR